MTRKKQNNIFDQVQKKTNVSEDQLKSLANQINPNDLSDEKKVRQLVSQVAALAGVPVSKEKEDQIVNYFVKNKVSMAQMQQVIQMFMQQKK